MLALKIQDIPKFPIQNIGHRNFACALEACPAIP